MLSVKNDLKNVNMADLGSEGNASIYINQSLCSYYKRLWSWSKKLNSMGKIYSWNGDSVSVTHTSDIIKHFHGVDATTFYYHN